LFLLIGNWSAGTAGAGTTSTNLAAVTAVPAQERGRGHARARASARPDSPADKSTARALSGHGKLRGFGRFPREPGRCHPTCLSAAPHGPPRPPGLGYLIASATLPRLTSIGLLAWHFFWESSCSKTRPCRLQVENSYPNTQYSLSVCA
jgi:hypothetical protein